MYRTARHVPLLAPALLLLLLSAARAEVEIQVEREADAIIVKSPIASGNFLFRAPPAFKRVAESPEGWLVALEAQKGAARARILLAIESLAAAERRKPLSDLASSRGRLVEGLEKPGAPVREGRGERIRVRVQGRGAARTVLLVRDGSRLYLLRMEERPPDKGFGAALAKVAEGFTILDPKGSAIPSAPSAAAAKPEVIEHAYYHLKVYKPAGFSRIDVDPDKDPGLFLHLRREDPERNLCELYVRVFLAKTLHKPLEQLARARMRQFAKQYVHARVPRAPRHTRWPGAREAFKLRLVGKLAKNGMVVTEEWRFVDHENGRVYEIEMVLYGAAERVWKKALKAFWKKFKILPS